MQNLKLERPIICFDLETTGAAPAKDRICQIAVTKFFPDGTVDKKTKYINPTISIPENASNIHGITDDMVKNQPTFAQVAKSLLDYFEGCDIMGYNIIRFDMPLLVEEFLRCDLDFPGKDVKIIDACFIFKHFERRTLSAAYKFYCDKILENAHDAGADVAATHEVLDQQIAKYPELGNTVDTASKIGMNEEMVDWDGKFIKKDGHYLMNFGKDKGKRVKDVKPGYFKWMLGADFTLDTKRCIRMIAEELDINIS